MALLEKSTQSHIWVDSDSLSGCLGPVARVPPRMGAANLIAWVSLDEKLPGLKAQSSPFDGRGFGALGKDVPTINPGEPSQQPTPARYET